MSLLGDDSYCFVTGPVGSSSMFEPSFSDSGFEGILGKPKEESRSSISETVRKCFSSFEGRASSQKIAGSTRTNSSTWGRNFTSSLLTIPEAPHSWATTLRHGLGWKLSSSLAWNSGASSSSPATMTYFPWIESIRHFL